MCAAGRRKGWSVGAPRFEAGSGHGPEAASAGSEERQEPGRRFRVPAIEVRSDIAGKVWKIEAAVGDALAADDTILILESMKMEIPVAAPASGRLAEIQVAEGEAVGEGDVVAVLEA